MSKWIDADELPRDTADVLVRTTSGLVLTGYIDTTGRWWVNFEGEYHEMVFPCEPLPERRDCRTTKLGADLTTGLGADQ